MNKNLPPVSAQLASQVTDDRVEILLANMTLAEKIGQMAQVHGSEDGVSDDHRRALELGQLGSVLNVVSIDVICELQRIALEDSRLGIPLLIGRDVIHGYKTIFPIPLGQAASWNPELIEQGARVAALEAATVGVNWTFAPMIDIARDPRWGRVAESLGEDPYLSGELGAAMVRGFQGNDLSAIGSIAACAKHFAGYGAAEGGVDYNTAIIAENELRNVYLPPFKAALDSGVATFMTAFNDLNGVPASGNEFLLKQILREEWCYQGMVVSDWESIVQLTEHGFTANDKEAAFEAANAGIDMEMVSNTYSQHLESLITEGRISLAQVDEMVKNILRLKFRLGLFENPYPQPDKLPALVNHDHRQAAKKLALESVVLLKNSHQSLPLRVSALSSIALIGPLADDAYEQLGTWIFDGDAGDSETVLQAINAFAGDSLTVNVDRALETTRSNTFIDIDRTMAAAQSSDAIVLCLGEESILSGEAHSRADISLPGAQEQLIHLLAKTAKPMILIVMAGRPLTLEPIIDHVDAILYAWHPGTMAGTALTDLLFGVVSPSGKLPITFPRMVGQVPIYYGKKNTGKPPSAESVVHMNDIAPRAAQTSLGMSAFHLDAGFTPLFPFGFGLSYTSFAYENIHLSSPTMNSDGMIAVTVDVINCGEREGQEVVQLYTRDLAANVTRPVKELKQFQKIHLRAGERQQVKFVLKASALAFYDRKMNRIIEPGVFHLWTGGNSTADLTASFEIVGDKAVTIAH